MKVFIVGAMNGPYFRMFEERGWEITYDFLKADLVQLIGGEDVTPEIYGEKNTSSYNSFERDLREAGFFAIAQQMGKPMAGICRGGQFLNVMCGGSMIQHVEGHAIHGTHLLYDFNMVKEIPVTSTHHQMMIEGIGGTFIAGASILSTDDGDAEVIHYEKQRCLCFQPHPEHRGYEECTDYYFELLERCLGLRS